MARRWLFSGLAKFFNEFTQRSSLQKIIFNAVRLNRPEIERTILDRDVQFLAFCLSRRILSRSQILQDLWVCFELGEKRGGYFVEFGATNGLKNSNTWLPEKSLGWKGILAEPNPIWHNDLRANRHGPIEHRCVSSRSNETVSFITTNDTDPELSGIAASADADHFAATRRSGTRIDVETISLDDLLDHYAAPPDIDYLSVDTEGSELDIISTYSFSRKFKLISIENNPMNEEAVDAILTANGYVRVFRQFSQWDSWYVSQEFRSEQVTVSAAPES